MHQALSLLYGHACCTPPRFVPHEPEPHTVVGLPTNHITLSFIDDVKKAFAAAAKYIYGLKKFEAGNMADDPVKGLINATYTVLKKAVTSQIDYRISDAFLKKLQTDVFVFSGMKTYVQLKEAAALLYTTADGGGGVGSPPAGGRGGLKPYAQFERDIQAINQSYNTRYLRTEYQYAATTGQNAARWQKYEAQKERYDLRYLTDNGPNVRESHRALEGTVLPVDDAFWNQYLPKNGWNCHCFVIQVRKGEYEVSDSDQAIKLGDKATTQLTKDGKNAAAMFRYNAGKQAVIFPPKHPYTLTRCGNKLGADADDKCQAKKIVEGMAKDGVEDAIWETHSKYENGGTLKIHHLVDKKANDFKGVLESSQHFAKIGEPVIILPKVSDKESLLYKELFGALKGTIYDGKSPDFKVGTRYYEHEGHEAKTNPNNWLKHMIRNGSDQASRIVIEKTNDTDRYIRRYINTWLSQPNNKYPIDEVWVKDGSELRIVYKKTKAE